MLNNKKDVAVVKRLTDEPIRQFSSSTVFVSRPAYCFIYQWEWFANEWAMVGPDAFVFGWDQLSLNFTIQQSAGFSIEFLKRELFIDDGFHPNAYFWTWGTPIQRMKASVYEFFNDHKLGQPLSMDALQHYMTEFFANHEYRAAFPFAHHLMMMDATNCDAMFVLGVVYFKELNNYPMAIQIFNALIDAGYNIEDCQQFVDAMK